MCLLLIWVCFFHSWVIQNLPSSVIHCSYQPRKCFRGSHSCWGEMRVLDPFVFCFPTYRKMSLAQWWTTSHFSQELAAFKEKELLVLKLAKFWAKRDELVALFWPPEGIDRELQCIFHGYCWSVASPSQPAFIQGKCQRQKRCLEGRVGLKRHKIAMTLSYILFSFEPLALFLSSTSSCGRVQATTIPTKCSIGAPG